MEYIHDGPRIHRGFPMKSVNNSFMGHTFRAEKIPLVSKHHQLDPMDVHVLEMEAYGAVLRAFIAQSDHLSWAKEGLITELRKELKVTDDEHRELLGQINSDDTIKMMRKCRECAPTENSLSVQVDSNALYSIPIGNATHKKLKPSWPTASNAKAYAPHGPPSSAAVPCSFSECYKNGKQNGKPAIYVDCSVERSMKSYNPTAQVPSVAKGNCTQSSLSNKGFNTQEAVPITEKSDLIQIRVTRDLISQVHKMVFGKKVLDPAQIEEAKLILREHEKAITEAIVKIDDLSGKDHRRGTTCKTR
ncbi:ENT domain [Dillenia turbinata]|uniref:ENT domain n=1 Tax=Dillenia turbinata TaxID=194707 RepID=A0AAN8W1B6_9MAGN